MFFKKLRKKKNHESPDESFKKLESPDEIFKKLKNQKHKETINSLDEYYRNSGIKAKEFASTGQVSALKHLSFLMSCVEKEKEVVDKGIDSYIFKDDIQDFLERRDIQASNIKMIELEDYTRVIPKDVQEKVKATKGIFTCYYVLFTDYSNTIAKQHQRATKQYQKDNDPILFGTFQQIKENNNSRFGRKEIVRDINDKFYVIGDWVDEYCDLTLDKFMALTSKETVHAIGDDTPLTLEEIEEKIKELEKKESDVSNIQF